jgi:ABC-2 type transport system ATP-binding protein
MTSINIINFSKIYKGATKAAVSNISFKVEKGQIHAFVGSNGAGKTTTIKSIIGGYSKHGYKGKIEICGLDNESKEAKNLIGYIPEDAIFPKNLNLKEFLTSMALFNSNSLKDASNKAESIIKDLNLERMKKRNPNSFSSGEKKRVLLAQALLNNPKVLILDEPAANLDPKNRMELYNNLVTIRKKGVSILLSSHILSELSEYADSLTIIEKGQIKYTGSVKDFESDKSVLNIQTLQVDDLISVIKEFDVKYEIKENNFEIEIKNENVEEFKKRMLDKKILLDKFLNNKKTIESIYKEVIKNEG